MFLTDVVDDRIVDLGAAVFRGYVIQRLSRDDPQRRLSPEDLGGDSNELEDDQIKDVVNQLLIISDNMNRNTELKHLVSSVQANCAQDVFFSVARDFLAEDINGGRVVALLDLTYRLIYLALTQNHFEVIMEVTSCFLQFIREHVCPWIRQQGGWEAVFSCVSHWRTVSIAVAVTFIAVGVCWRYSC
ncbi:hypothetical protein DPEC_G00344030 [Dallia pectoralis]|uniref:Uncharacterized protein n=1 Tax=Dallia pectoralis TaxID=75939 RepID=A0ACC2F346_DALPE|nr:hypothetical protein DPEC_G00344030 [Dallia pectoralis]